MAKKDPEIERLLKENRDLKSLVRSLRKRLKKVDRYYEETIEAEEAAKEKDEGAPQARRCLHCGKGEIQEIDLLGRKFESCTICDWRSGAKKKS